MKKNIIYIALFIVATFLVSCGGGSSSTPKNDPPSGVTLQFPTANMLCIDNNITFNWTDATDPNNDNITYNVIIAKDRALTQGTINRTVTTSEVTILMEKAVAYYWSVTPVDAKDEAGPEAPVFAFFTKGDGITNAVPYSAKLDSPENGGFVAAGTINLNWTGADADDSTDSLTYELYFGETADPVLTDNSLSIQNIDKMVETGKTYYWKVNTIDNSGAKSIGQVWSFTVN